jgi:hypothetical protein
MFAEEFCATDTREVPQLFMVDDNCAHRHDLNDADMSLRALSACGFG